VVRGRETGLAADATALEHARHEMDAAVVEERHQVRVLDERGDGDTVAAAGTEARVVDQIHCAAARMVHEVSRGNADGKEGSS